MDTTHADADASPRPNLAAGDAVFFSKFKDEFTHADISALDALFRASLAGRAISAVELVAQLHCQSSAETLAQRLRKIAGKLVSLKCGYELVAYGFKPQRWVFQACPDRLPRERCIWEVRHKPDGTRVIAPLPGMHSEAPLPAAEGASCTAGE